MVNLRVFSNFSLGESILKPDMIVRLAVTHKQSAVAMIDRMNMFGALEFSLIAIKNKIKPILGCLLKVKDYGYIPIYIKNHNGYVAISKLLTNFYIHKQEYISIEELIVIKDIIVLWGGEESQFADEQEIDVKLSFLKEVFGNNFYIEIQNSPYRNVFLNAAMKLHIPIVYTHSTFFEQGSFEAYYTFTCILKGQIYAADELNNHARKNAYFLNDQELKEGSFYEEGILNAISISERCNFTLESKTPMIPEFVKDNPEQVLRDLVMKGLEWRLKQQGIPAHAYTIYYDRVNRELAVLNEKGFCNYFLITHDFVTKARELNIPVGPGRGSGTGSLVAYSLTITDVDPIAFNLIFERFLNPERISLPDLDIDYCQEKRDLIIDYLISKYGQENVSHIITFGTLKSRIVVRDVGRALSIPLAKVDAISKFIPQDQVNPVTLAQAVVFDKKLMEMFQQNEETKKLLEICLKLEGLVRHISTHAAGVVIYLKENSSISDHMPLYRVLNESLVCTQFSMKYVEIAGMVKFDFLGLQTLTLIRKTCELIKMSKNIDIVIEEVPTDDEATFIFIGKLLLSGVFQLDSFGMKSVVHGLKPTSLEDIIVAIALFRPGPMKLIPLYISNKQGTTQIKYLLPILESILQSTYGIMVYQEQVLEMAVKVGGYTLGEADSLRRAMGKKDPKEMQQQEDKFLKGAQSQGVSTAIAKELFNQMSVFAGYGFNKSHAAPYALIAYRTAYLKCHYPLEFMSCLMTLDKDDTNKLLIYLNDLKKMHIDLLPPCIQKSQFNFSIDGNSIRFGLGAIKNMGEAFANSIVYERETNGLYRTVDDFIHRNIKYINKRQLEYLIYSGALDCLNVKKNLLIQNLSSLAKGETVIDNTITLAEDVYWEMEALGFFLHKHPMSEDDYRKLGLLTIDEVMSLKKEKDYAKMGGIVYSITKKKTHYNNKTYMFIKLIDISGMFEVTLFSEILNKYLHLIHEKAPLVLNVQYEKQHNIIKIIVLKVTSFSDYKKEFNTSIKIFCNKSKLPVLKSILELLAKQDISAHKVLLIHQKKQYLLPFYMDINQHLLQQLTLAKIKFEY